uniref:Uncharacterized protein n=1 Tax=uncultured bacterium contig00070 TaxID=1181551 RepID=A0A806K190_9BACT|nr:hypothetical protein [uncultured bacterium contig00070]
MLVLSNSEYNNVSKDVIVVAITSNLLQNGIKISNNDMSVGFLPKASVVKIDKVYTLEQSIVIKKIGKVNECVSKDVFDEFVKLINVSVKTISSAQRTLSVTYASP